MSPPSTTGEDITITQAEWEDYYAARTGGTTSLRAHSLMHKFGPQGVYLEAFAHFVTEEETSTLTIEGVRAWMVCGAQH